MTDLADMAVNLHSVRWSYNRQHLVSFHHAFWAHIYREEQWYRCRVFSVSDLLEYK